MGRDGVALFEGSAGATAIATPCRNALALEGWLETLHRSFGTRRLHAVVELAPDWRPEDAAAIGVRLSAISASLCVLADDAAKPLSDALRNAVGESIPVSFYPVTAMPGAISEKVDRLGPGDLLFVVPATGESQRKALSYLVEKGMSRRRVSGLASVEHCR